MSNIIRIKRRLPDSLQTGLPTLQGGELAFNEINSTLYYGASSASGTDSIPIGGSGAYVDRTTSQSIEGDKTFTGITTLSSTTFSVDSTIDFGGNILTNVADPVNDQDVATKKFVIDQTSGNFVEKVEDEAVELSGGLTVTNGLTADTLKVTSTSTLDSLEVTNNTTVGGNLSVTGNLTVLGTTTTLDTTTTVTSSFNITNVGTTTALTVEQTGATDIAEFIDDGTTAFIIKDGGNIGVNTDSPNEKLTVVGNISADGNVFAINGDFTGTLDVDGAVIFGSTLGVTDAVDLDSTLNVDGNTTIHGTLSTVGVVTFDDALNVGGVLTVTSDASLQSSLTVTANISGTSGSSELVDFIIDGGSF